MYSVKDKTDSNIHRLKRNVKSCYDRVSSNVSPLFVFYSLVGLVMIDRPLLEIVMFRVLTMVLYCRSVYYIISSSCKLGKNFSVLSKPVAGNTVVDTGIYTNIRHPMYSNIFLLCLCITILGNRTERVVITTAIGALGDRIASHEEDQLLSLHPDVYKDYKSRTKKYIPHLY